MFDTVFGLPVHVLVVHAVVVLGPIAALMAIAYAVLPAHRLAGLRWPTIGVTVVATLSAIVAASSGEELEHRLEALGENSPALHTHTEAGDLARTVMIGFAIVVVAALVWALRPGDRPVSPMLQTVARVVLVIISLVALFAVVRAGHTGAQVAWGDVINQVGK
jgi:hypothetical protein